MKILIVKSAEGYRITVVAGDALQGTETDCRTFRRFSHRAQGFIRRTMEGARA